MASKTRYRKPRSYAFQPRVKGIKRVAGHCGELPGLNDKVVQLAWQHGVSPSWVRATLLAKALGDDEQPDFRTRRKPGEVGTKLKG